jgi:large subunit ribosomal protein L1
MSKLTKKQKKFASIDRLKLYSAVDAINLVKENATAKFDESVDIAVRLGVDPRKADQMLRGSLVLPHGTGKACRVAVFANGDMLQVAKAAGADITIEAEELVNQIKSGVMNFDLLIATPDMMRVVGTLGQILGPRGLMPNPKLGTVTNDVATAVKNAKMGQIQYRTDKQGIIHTTIGRASFSVDNLHENLLFIIKALAQVKPASAKGQYFKGLAVSSTMGIGLKVDCNPLLNASR